MGVTYLLDTHVFLWLLGSPERVPSRVRDELGIGSNRLAVSAASAMEVATKTRLGKLEAGRHLVPTWSSRVAAISADELAVSSGHAVLAGSMPWDHRDPFDRLLVAQALIDNLTLVTTDAAVIAFPGIRTLTW